MMKEMISEFFVPIVNDVIFESLVVRWLDSQDNYPWDTSRIKIVNNLIIGAKRHKYNYDES